MTMITPSATARKGMASRRAVVEPLSSTPITFSKKSPKPTNRPRPDRGRAQAGVQQIQRRCSSPYRKSDTPTDPGATRAQA